MKKQRIQMLVLTCLLLVASVFFIIIKKTDVLKDEETSTEDYSVVDLDPDKVVEITYNIDSEKIDIIKSGDEWTLADDENAGIDNDLINSMINIASNVTSKYKLDNIDNMAEYGLDNPESIVTLTLNDNTQVKLLIGATENISNGNYVAIEGENTVYVVSASYHSGVLKSLDSLTADTEGED